jgi:hypothetical protein
VQDFEFYVDDDRSRDPRVFVVMTRDSERARVLASRCLAESAHHRGIEVRAARQRLFGLGSCEAVRSWATPADG